MVKSKRGDIRATPWEMSSGVSSPISCPRTNSSTPLSPRSVLLSCLGKLQDLLSQVLPAVKHRQALYSIASSEGWASYSQSLDVDMVPVN